MKQSLKTLAVIIALTVGFVFTVSDFAALYAYAAEENLENEAAVSEEVNEEVSQIDAHEHVFGEWNVVTEPTYTTKGLKERVCECGETESEVIPCLEGANKVGKKWYYYRNGKKVTGTKWINDENGLRTYHLTKGVVNSGWKTIKVKVGKKKKKMKFYFGASEDGTPRMATGYKIISDKPYYFTPDTASTYYGRAATKGFVNDESGMNFYSTGNGALKTGWIGIDSKLYYFYKAGESETPGLRAYNYQDPKYYRLYVGENGYLDGTKGKIFAYGVNKLNKYGWSLKGAYKASYKIRYANRPYRPKTVAEGATYGFSKGKGNCYVMNCCFHVMADILGEEVRQVRSSVGSYKAPHSWLEIRQDGKWWVYDANFRNETGRNGFKIYYGKSGTWRYNKSTNYLPKGYDPEPELGL